MKNAYVMNVDYEFQLFDPHYERDIRKYHRMRAEFEFVYFFIGQGKGELVCHRQYENSYLDYLASIGLSPSISENKQGVFYWGELKNCENERKFNSKVFSHKLLEEYQLAPLNSGVFNSMIELRQFFKKNSFDNGFVLKSFYSVSGRRVHFYKTLSDQFLLQCEQYLNEGPILIYPYHKRCLDLGLRFINQKPMHRYINLVSSSGSFQGSLIGNGHFQNLTPLMLEKLEHCFATMERIGASVIKKGAEIDFTVDGYLFEDENAKIQQYPLSEINYRKSMGLLGESLKRYILPGHYGQWVIAKSPKVDCFEVLLEKLGNNLYSTNNCEGIIPLSPVGGQFFSFFLTYDCYQKLGKMKNKLLDFISY